MNLAIRCGGGVCFKHPQDVWKVYGLTSRKHTGQTTYLRCRVSGDLVDQFASQHTKGSIVMLYGNIVHQYDQDAKNRVNNLIDVMGWLYFADIDAHLMI